MAIRAAEDVLGRRTALLLEIRLTGRQVASADMICGGRLDVLVQAFTPEDTRAREVLEAVLRLVEKGGRGILATGPLPAPGQEVAVDLMLYQPGAEPVGRPPGGEATLALVQDDAQRVLAANMSKLIHIGPDRLPVFIEPLFSRPTAVIFGGGHISVNLAPLLSMADFQVVVIDDRAEFANETRFPQADRVVVSDYQSCFDHLVFTPETYVVIVTRGHLHDKIVLEQALRQPTRYIGMIGSRRKRNMMYEALVADGTDPELLKTIHSPIGLDIGAETPEEIAISIAAELIHVRSEGLRLVKDWNV
jgi:xanthine dehydrogenase accessory factor